MENLEDGDNFGYLKKDITCFAYGMFNDREGNRMKLYPYQDLVLNDKSKRILLCIARQAGKTTTAAIKALHFAYFNNNVTVVVVSATKPQAIELIRRVREVMNLSRFSWWRDLSPSAKESRGEIVLKNSGAKTTSRIISVPATDAARGYTADLVIVDEAAFIEGGDYIFNQVVEPMTQATKGNIMLLSTPKAMSGYFYECYKSPFWSTYQFDWRSNPKNTEEDMAEKQSRMTISQYQAEYEAKFTNTLGSYFRLSDINKCTEDDPPRLSKGVKGLVCGVDLGKERDHAVFFIGNYESDKEEAKVVVRERRVKPLGTNYAEIIGELVFLNEQYNIDLFVIDGTGIGAGIADMLIAKGLNVESVVFSWKSKVDIFSNLKILFEQERILIPNEVELINQLTIFTEKFTETGRALLHAPEGEHDDECDALALLAWGLVNKSFPVSISFVDPKSTPSGQLSTDEFPCRICGDGIPTQTLYTSDGQCSKCRSKILEV